MHDERQPPARPAPAAGVRVVGLGASAGGLEPLEQFLSHLPLGSGLACLVVQHLDPLRKTLLGELLQRASPMAVHEAVDGKRIEADAVYVIPPAAELTVRGGTLHLSVPTQKRGLRRPIDALFESLARDHGEQAIGVVLSGMGADGTRGLQAIRARGGLTLAQRPESAQFDSMPRSALATGCVDIVALPAELPGRLLQAIGTQVGAAQPAMAAPSELAVVLALLREHTQHDMTLYKPSTLERRIQRRVAVHGLPSMAAYAEFLRANPQEAELLFKEMLIGVTAFFRDAQAWHDLQHQVLPTLLARHCGETGPLRAWVVACSTGEEAYSLAMAFIEARDSLPGSAHLQLQIFATDLNPEAVAAARSGRYGASLAQSMQAQRLARFFSARPDGYLIDKRVRDMVLFAQHDVVVDPPFTRLDILCCRNLLIYFGNALQKRLIPLFHYSLRSGGVLFLGCSETTGRTPALFSPVDTKSRLYWRSPQNTAGSAVEFPSHRRSPPRPASQEKTLVHNPPPPDKLQALADQWLLQAHGPAAVLVNSAGDIVYINGRTGRYLEPAAGKANWNIHVMARPGIRAQLAGALRAALQSEQAVELRGLQLEDDGAPAAAVDISVQAVAQPAALTGMAMIVFRDVPPASGRRRRAGRAPGAASSSDTEATAAADEELGRSRQEIQALRQEMRASQEELQAAIEELQSTNEELQSANEELTTSKEESQSMNEELQTINGELQSKLDELALAQSDMHNLLNSTDIATLFLDKELNVRRYTDRMARVVHLRAGDIGRPLSELASTLLYPEFHADVQATLRTLGVSERQISTSDGLWFTVRVMPYRTLADVIQGVVITFVDITAAKELESRLRGA